MAFTEGVKVYVKQDCEPTMQTRNRKIFSKEGLFQKKRSVQTRAGRKNKPEQGWARWQKQRGSQKKRNPKKNHLTSLFHKTPEPVSNLPLDDLTQNRQRIREPELNTADPDKLTSSRWETPEKSASHALPAPMSKTSQIDKQGNKGK